MEGNRRESEDISSPTWGLDRLTASGGKYAASKRCRNFPSSDLTQKNHIDHLTCKEGKSCNQSFTSNDLRRLNNAGSCRGPTPTMPSCTSGGCIREDSYRTKNLCSTRSRHRTYFTLSVHNKFFLQLAVLLLAFTFTCSAGRRKQEKNPLVTTDALKSSGFRTFLKESEEAPMGRSFTPPNNAADVETLDFQTLKVIKKWGNDTDILLVSGRNYVYMLDSTMAGSHQEIEYLERLAWKTQRKSQLECRMMGKKAYECHNFIRVVELMDNGELMVCGTNAYSPTCRYYKRNQFNEPDSGDDSNYQSEVRCRGQCIVPYNPATASATLYANTTNGPQIFTAVVNDFLSNDPVILRKQSTSIYSNSDWLNDPTFLKIIDFEDKIYVFFREIAKESESGISDRVTYARVAQICKDDAGGVSVLAQQWTTFLKARLRCGYADKQRPEYNNMTSVSDIVKVNDGSGPLDAIFATFTTPWEWEDESFSAVCMFTMQDIKKIFETGNFMGEYELDAKPKERPEMPSMDGPSFSAQSSIKKLTRAYPIPADAVTTRPGSCSKKYSPQVLDFAKKHPQIYDPVETHYGAPIFVTKSNERITQVAVDSNAGENGKLVIYLGTEYGKVLRLRALLEAAEGPKAVFLETTNVADEEMCAEDKCTVRALHISRPPHSTPANRPTAFVAFSDHAVQFPLMRCDYTSKICCSWDPDCGWNGKSCVERTSRNSKKLEPTTQVGDIFPKACDQTSYRPDGTGCECGKNKRASCNHDEDVTDDEGFQQESLQSDVDLRSILLETVLPAVEKEFGETRSFLRHRSQWQALEKQLEEAMISTASLVFNNHRQEYCLPSPTVNHLTHVYPLLLREIEIWHETALKKMTEDDFTKSCWNKARKNCIRRVSFSIPLVPVLWEPLTKLISDFAGECETIPPTGVEPPQPETRSECAPLPGTETCKDARLPHCHPKRCKFPKYAIDVKAFFRHANDSRQFLAHGDNIEPLWKPVNVTLSSTESVRGHLELDVSERMPFVIDYSPVAEKVKIMFHYSAVRDCALTEPMCVGTAPGCNPEVEKVVNQWFEKTMSRLSHKLRRCDREIMKAQRVDRRERHKRERRSGFSGRAEVADRSDRLIHLRTPGSNLIMARPDRCKRITGRLPNITRNLWSLIVSRCQRSGGVYSEFDGAIKFTDRSHVIRFFKNMCIFEPTVERRTLRKKMKKARSESFVTAEVMVTPNTPFIIQRNASTGKFILKYFTKAG